MLEVKSKVHDVHLNERFQSIKESDRFHFVLGEYNVFIQPSVTSAAQEPVPISEKIQIIKLSGHLAKLPTVFVWTHKHTLNFTLTCDVLFKQLGFFSCIFDCSLFFKCYFRHRIINNPFRPTVMWVTAGSGSDWTDLGPVSETFQWNSLKRFCLLNCRKSWFAAWITFSGAEEFVNRAAAGSNEVEILSYWI